MFYFILSMLGFVFYVKYWSTDPHGLQNGDISPYPLLFKDLIFISNPHLKLSSSPIFSTTWTKTLLVLVMMYFRGMMTMGVREMDGFSSLSMVPFMPLTMPDRRKERLKEVKRDLPLFIKKREKLCIVRGNLQEKIKENQKWIKEAKKKLRQSKNGSLKQNKKLEKKKTINL